MTVSIKEICYTLNTFANQVKKEVVLQFPKVDNETEDDYDEFIEYEIYSRIIDKIRNMIRWMILEL